MNEQFIFCNDIQVAKKLLKYFKLVHQNENLYYFENTRNDTYEAKSVIDEFSDKIIYTSNMIL